MGSVGKDSNVYKEFELIKNLSIDKDGKTSLSELKKIDTDSDGVISKEELNTAGIKNEKVKNEISEKFNNKDAPKDDVKIKVLDYNKVVHDAQNSIRRYFDNVNEHNSIRALLNSVMDDNQDGKIVLGEVKKFNADQSKKDKLIESIEKSEPGNKKIIKAIEVLEMLEFVSKEKKDSAPVLGKLHESDNWGTYWEFHNSLHSKVKSLKNDDIKLKDSIKNAKTPDEITNLNAPLETAKNNFLGKISDDAGKKLLDKTLSFESVDYMNNILEKQGKEKFLQVCNILNKYIGNSEDKGKIRLAKDILHDISYPSNIDQGSKGTCAATAVQMKLAILDPVKYAKMCTDFAIDKPFKLPDNKQISPNITFIGDKNDDRSLSCKIMQNAFMGFSRPEGKNFHSKYSGDEAQGIKLTKEQREQMALGNGMQSEDIEKLEKGIFNKKTYGFNVQQISLENHPKTQEEKKENARKAELSIKNIEDELSRGRPVTISFQNHTVIVTGIDKNDDPPSFIINSWGNQYKIRSDNLKKVIDDATFAKDTNNDNNMVNVKKLALGD